ncbi:hypothetical protein ACOZ4F_14260 [Haloarcula marismortui]
MSWGPLYAALFVAAVFIAIIQYGFWKNPEGMYEAVRGEPHPNNRPDRDS